MAPEAAGSKPVIHPSFFVDAASHGRPTAALWARGLLLATLGASSVRVGRIVAPPAHSELRSGVDALCARSRACLCIAQPLSSTASPRRESLNRWRLDGARAVVTGGTRGIGLAVVLELLELGASVVTAGRDLEDLDPRLTPARDAGRLTLIATDLATADGRAALLDAIPDAWDALDILVNNVGTNVRQPSLAVTDDDYQRILDTNVTCAWDLVARAASAARRRRGAARSSTSDRSPARCRWAPAPSTR